MFVPRTVNEHHNNCHLVTKKFTLEEHQIGHLHCRNEGCLIALIPSAVTLIVSGSVVLIGNTIHWLEKQGKCHNDDNDLKNSKQKLNLSLKQ